MSGAGNDFVVINNMDRRLTTDKSLLAVALCSRRSGIGADGLLLMEPSAEVYFSMLYYNADGSYGGMCGNGGRCIARFAFDEKVAPSNLTFEALGQSYTAVVSKSSVKLQMILPKDLSDKMVVLTSSGDTYGFYIDTGSPHFVIETENVDDADVETLGRELRYHQAFTPKGCNVNFVERMGESSLKIRTYERGVEAETLACGTGAVAASVVFASVSSNVRSPVNLRVRSGEELIVHFRQDGNELSDIVLEGSAHRIFSGIVEFDTITNVIVDHPSSPNNSSSH